MIWQVARVFAGPGGHLALELSSPEVCQRCSRGEGCGAGLFAGLLLRGHSRLELAGRSDLAVGDWVRAGLPAGQLARASVVFYGLPLAGFLIGALGLHGLLGPVAWRDVAALGGGLAGLAAVALALRLRPLRGLEPVIERLSCIEGATISTDENLTQKD